jgi:hypothetical protein
MSRNPHKPTPETRKLVRTLAGVGQDQEDISKQVGISAKTLRFYYREELDDGKAEANAAVIGKLYELIRAEIRSAAIFCDKCRGGKKEEPVQKAKKKINRFTDPRWKAYWEKIAARTKEHAGHCNAEQCAKAIRTRILFELGISSPRYLTQDKLRMAIAQVEAQLRVAEKEVETQVPYYEL